MVTIGSIIFFFSSRRRHTIWTGDWSSDVCSSDLHVARRGADVTVAALHHPGRGRRRHRVLLLERHHPGALRRSEERRVGKEGYPQITVPMGYDQHMPVDLSFFGTARSEGILIGAA